MKIQDFIRNMCQIRPKNRGNFQNVRAFSIIEILLAVTILTGVFYTVTSLFSGSAKQVENMRIHEEILSVSQNAYACFRSIGYSGFVDASGNLTMTGGSLSFGVDNTKCLTGSFDAPKDIEIHTYFGSGSKSETQVGSRMYVDTFTTSTGTNSVIINNTVSAYASGGTSKNFSFPLYKK